MTHTGNEIYQVEHKSFNCTLTFGDAVKTLSKQKWLQ